MKTLVAFPSTGVFAQQVALAFAERGELEAFFTSFAYKHSSLLGQLIDNIPGTTGTRIRNELGRRAITALPEQLVETNAFWEVIRTCADRAKLGRKVVDQIWDHASREFTRAAGERLARGADAIYSFEYTSLEAFAVADRIGAAKILDFPSLNSRQFQELHRNQKSAFPELEEPEDDYFEAQFERRQARRDAEMRAADVIITNSTVTRASHIAGGADPGRTFSVPCGAPPPVETIALNRDPSAPLRVIWAGTFSIRKGAHLLLEAWSRLARGGDIELDVYGAVTLPDRLLTPAPQRMEFHGSVVRSVLFAAYDKADILVFPTLSDGFGMVVTEAFSRGLPVITTDQAGASDLVRHGENGLIIPAGDSTAIVNALSWCLNNRAQLLPMSYSALDTARSWQWSDYRRALYGTVRKALVEQGKRAD